MLVNTEVAITQKEKKRARTGTAGKRLALRRKISFSNIVLMLQLVRNTLLISVNKTFHKLKKLVFGCLNSLYINVFTL